MRNGILHPCGRMQNIRDDKIMMTTKLKYGNTNTFLISGSKRSLLIDTDYAGKLYAFYKAIKDLNIKVKDISYVLATHYHPDHMGLIGELMRQGVKLLLVDVQKESVHFSDPIFARDKVPFAPVNEADAVIITCAESRKFLAGSGIEGEIIHCPSHSPDSVALILDNGDCFVGDLEPLEYLSAYEDNQMLQNDWDHVLAFDPKRIFYAHANEKDIEAGC